MRRACVLIAGLAATLVVGSAGAAERPAAQQWVALPLPSLGVPAIPDQFFKIGMSMLTVDFVDDSHLLLTFGTRGLIPRIPGDPPTDDDRMVAAELVELPSGRIVARSDWHFHDHGRYLWRLGHGRFLVRTRNTLFALTPLALLHSPDPLARIAFPPRPGLPLAVMISPDASLAMVERWIRVQGSGAKLEVTAATNDDSGGEPSQQQVLVDFYRLRGGDGVEAPLIVDEAGMVRSLGLLPLPMTSDGYLWPGDPKRDSWPVKFNGYGGKAIAVGTVDSSCIPRLEMVSRFEYLAFACQGTDDRMKLQAFGMDGHETWEEGFGASTGAPVFAYAPEAGRFAMSRISTALPGGDATATVPDDATQEVRVYQTESGDLLLRAQTTPVMRFGQNFDLSADGREAVVVSGGAVRVYKLPPPSAQDRKDQAEAAKFAPPASEGEVLLTALLASSGRASEGRASEAGGGAAKSEAMGAAAAAGTETAANGGAGAAQGSSAAGPDAVGPGSVGAAPGPAVAPPVVAANGGGNEADSGPRKRPTLLLPGETAEFKGPKVKRPE
jgi:hypothetical protein